MIYRIMITLGFQVFAFIMANTMNEYIGAMVFSIVLFIVLFGSMVVTFHQREKNKQTMGR